jgi:hypothetical protein
LPIYIGDNITNDKNCAISDDMAQFLSGGASNPYKNLIFFVGGFAMTISLNNP